MLLAIDTSGSQTSVVVVENKPPSSTNNLVQGGGQCGESHSSSLAALVQAALSQKNISVNDLSAIIIGAGPGSFTGLRIGFAFAKGLAIADKLPIYSISSLSAAAWQYKDRGEMILALDDARRGEFFAAAYRYDNNIWIQELKDQILSIDAVADWIDKHSRGLLVSANPEISKIWPQVCISTNIAVALAEQAITTGLVSATALKAFGGIGQLAELAPVYIRKVAAMTIEERASVAVAVL